MTNQAVQFKLVETKQIKSVVTGERHMFPVQVAMTIQVNGKQQRVSFGYSGLGGSQTYVCAKGKVPTRMSRADFLNTLRQSGVKNIQTVTHALKRIQYFSRDEFIVAKCECCEKGYVTAKNVDFIQKHHAMLSEKLGRTVTEFSRICNTCQGRPVVKPAVRSEAKPQESVKPACENCGKTVSQGVYNYSMKEFGKVLCWGSCQDKHRKPVAKPETIQQETSPTIKHQDTGEVRKGLSLSLALVEELLALEVQPGSEIAKFQETLRPRYEQKKQKKTDAKVKQNIKEQIKQLEEMVIRCNVCTEHAPQGWTLSTCPVCAVNPYAIQQGEVADEITQAAMDYMNTEEGAECLAIVKGLGFLESKPVAEERECVSCLNELSHDYEGTMCEECIIDHEQLMEESARAFQVAEVLRKGASEASIPSSAQEKQAAVASEASLDNILSKAEQAEETDGVSAEDTKEVPQADASEETVCKSQDSEAFSSDLQDQETPQKVNDFLNQIAVEFQVEGGFPGMEE